MRVTGHEQSPSPSRYEVTDLMARDSRYCLNWGDARELAAALGCPLDDVETFAGGELFETFAQWRGDSKTGYGSAYRAGFVDAARIMRRLLDDGQIVAAV